MYSDVVQQRLAEFPVAIERLCQQGMCACFDRDQRIAEAQKR